MGGGRLVTVRVDSHHHLWDLAVRPQPWLAPDAMAPIRRSFAMVDLVADASGSGFDATVVVQTVPDVAETEELLDLAAATPLILGVVGFVDLQAPDVGEELDRLRSRPGGGWLVGIRSPVQDEPDPRWLLRPEVLSGLRAVAERGLVYDLLIRPRHLGAALRAVTSVPDGRFVIDHLAKPAIASGGSEHWTAGMAALALRENVAAKLSGLVTEASWQSWTLDDLRPYADHALSCFGSDRVLFGSDWPVCRLAATYAEVAEAAEALTGPLNPRERDAVMGDTAVITYGLRVGATGSTG